MVDPLESGTELTPMELDGLPANLRFTGRLDASYFRECGFLGSLRTVDSEYYILRSPDGIRWECIGNSRDLEVTNSADILLRSTA